MQIRSQLIPWKNVEKWMCIRCGKCCSNLDVPVTYEDEKRLKEYGDVFTRGKIGLYLKTVGGRCVFFRDGQCTIYNKRPEACKRYPFYFRCFGDDDALFCVGDVRLYVYIDPECSGIGRGENVERVIVELLKSTIKIRCC